MGGFSPPRDHLGPSTEALNMAGRRFIISVGTSIVSCYDEKYKATPTYIDKDFFKNERLSVNNFRENPTYKRYAQWLQGFCQRLNSEEIATCCAELSSLLLGDPKITFTAADRIHLVATHTPEGYLCAETIRDLIEEKWAEIGEGRFHEDIVSIEANIEGLGRADDPKFETVGLPNFIDHLVRVIDCAQEVMLVPTGGYKALVPYMVIAGILHEVPCWYVYEDSAKVLTLPPLPMHVDLSRWYQLESLMEALEEKEGVEDHAIYQTFRTRLAGLMTQGIEGKSRTLKRTGLSKFFSNQAHSIATHPELYLRTHNSPLLALLEETDRRLFEKLAQISHLIWKGDRVPEMADHALRHHNDLLLLAERFLLPIFIYRPNFLESHELLVLMGALLFHDCGHVVGHIDIDGEPTRLLPTEVRDHHHVLGYIRLTEPDRHGGTGKVLIDRLDLKEAPTLLNAIATIGLYHRKKMLIRGDDKYKFFDRKFSSLESKLKDELLKVPRNGSNGESAQEPKSIEFDRAKLLVALLRIIDSLDEQGSRAGEIHDVGFHLSFLEIEAQEEEERAERLKGAIGGIGAYQETIEDLDRQISLAMGHFKGAEGKGQSETETEKVELRDKIKPLIEKAGKSHLKPLFWEYVQAKISADFKRFQKIPFGEKVFIDKVVIETTCESGTIHVYIDMDLLQEPQRIALWGDVVQTDVEKNDEAYDMTTDEGRERFRRFMLRDLKKEYDDKTGGGCIKSILNDEHNIYIHYNSEG